MESKKRSPVKAQITYEVNEFNDTGDDEFSYFDHDDVYINKSPNENDTFDIEFILPESTDKFIEALERWTDSVPDEISKDEFEEGFGMMQYDEEYAEADDLAEFASTPHDYNAVINTSIPQKIVIYFDDGSEEEIQITNQEETLRRVLDMLK